jgi:hypothetical protein
MGRAVGIHGWNHHVQEGMYAEINCIDVEQYSSQKPYWVLNMDLIMFWSWQNVPRILQG